MNHTQGRNFLEVNDQIYRRFVRLVEESPDSDPEAKLNLIRTAALSATRFHTGRFADGRIENPALLMGQKLSGDRRVAELYHAAVSGRRRRVLHVATQLSAIGGHTRMIRVWAERDGESRHAVVATDQVASAIPPGVHDAMERTGGQVIGLPPDASIVDRALDLRALARQADVVFLHLHSFDVVPVVAFAVPDTPPCVWIDIADHEFWLGSTIADLNVNLRAEGARFAEKRRFPKQTWVLPIPLETPSTGFTRETARQELGIPEDQIMVLTVGRGEKYRPSLPFDFVATANKLLERHQNAHLYLVGETRAGIAPYLRVQPHERLHFMGPQEDPSCFRAAADVYVESFPFGSQTALLESALTGLPVVPAYNRSFPLLGTNDEAINDLLPDLCTESDYIDAASRLIEDPALRQELGTELQRRLHLAHVGPQWDQHLVELYRQTDPLSHHPGAVPETASLAEPEDVALSIWHAAADGETWTSEAPSHELGRRRHAAFVSRSLGSYSSAFQSAVVAFSAAPVSIRSWRLLALAALGAPGRSLLDQGKRAVVRGRSRRSPATRHGQ